MERGKSFFASQKKKDGKDLPFFFQAIHLVKKNVFTAESSWMANEKLSELISDDDNPTTS